MSECLQKIKATISNQLGHKIEDINLDSNFVDDLNADSLDLIELVMRIEHDFEIEIDEHQLDQITTVRDVFNIVCEGLK